MTGAAFTGPATTTTSSRLNHISCPSASAGRRLSRVRGGGSYYRSGKSHSLIEHWNGHTWSIAP